MQTMSYAQCKYFIDTHLKMQIKRLKTVHLKIYTIPASQYNRTMKINIKYYVHAWRFVKFLHNNVTEQWNKHKVVTIECINYKQL